MSLASGVVVMMKIHQQHERQVQQRSDVQLRQRVMRGMGALFHAWHPANRSPELGQLPIRRPIPLQRIHNARGQRVVRFPEFLRKRTVVHVAMLDLVGITRAESIQFLRDRP